MQNLSKPVHSGTSHKGGTTVILLSIIKLITRNSQLVCFQVHFHCIGKFGDCNAAHPFSCWQQKCALRSESCVLTRWYLTLGLKNLEIKHFRFSVLSLQTCIDCIRGHVNFWSLIRSMETVYEISGKGFEKDIMCLLQKPALLITDTYKNLKICFFLFEEFLFRRSA